MTLEPKQFRRVNVTLKRDWVSVLVGVGGVVSEGKLYRIILVILYCTFT